MKIWAYIAALALITGAIGTAAWRVHHAWWQDGADAQMQKDQKSINDAVTAEKATAAKLAAKTAAYDKLVAETRAASAANERAAAKQKAQADALVKQAQADAAQSKRALDQWMATYAKAIRTPECQAANPQLCPALRDY